MTNPLEDEIVRQYAARFTDQGTNDYVETQETIWLRSALSRYRESVLEEAASKIDAFETPQGITDTMEYRWALHDAMKILRSMKKEV